MTGSHLSRVICQSGQLKEKQLASWVERNSAVEFRFLPTEEQTLTAETANIYRV